MKRYQLSRDYAPDSGGHVTTLNTPYLSTTIIIILSLKVMSHILSYHRNTQYPINTSVAEEDTLKWPLSVALTLF